MPGAKGFPGLWGPWCSGIPMIPAGTRASPPSERWLRQDRCHPAAPEQTPLHREALALPAAPQPRTANGAGLLQRRIPPGPSQGCCLCPHHGSYTTGINPPRMIKEL